MLDLVSQALFLHNVRLPLFADFNAPEKYGLSPNSAVNLKLTTPDGESIGAWFIFSDGYRSSLTSTADESHISKAIAGLSGDGKRTPIILFFHGNGATRALPARIAQYKTIAARSNAHVLAIDYRGFADSSGTPTEEGLIMDARTAVDWLVNDQGARFEDILIMGHSLGTGVTAQLAARLEKQGIKCRGYVLLSPFTSIVQVVETYKMFGSLPLYKPFSMVPGAASLIKQIIPERFNTLGTVPHISSPVLIAHAQDDWIISHTQSDILFNAFLVHESPPNDINAVVDPAERSRLDQHREAAVSLIQDQVKRKVIDTLGHVAEFVDHETSRKVTLVKTLKGGHDYLGAQEGLLDIISDSFDLGKPSPVS